MTVDTGTEHIESADPDALLTISDVAALYRIKVHTARTWLSKRDGRLPDPIRVGRNFVRFRRRDVLDRIAAMARGEV